MLGLFYPASWPPSAGDFSQGMLTVFIWSAIIILVVRAICSKEIKPAEAPLPSASPQALVPVPPASPLCYAQGSTVKVTRAAAPHATISVKQNRETKNEADFVHPDEAVSAMQKKMNLFRRLTFFVSVVAICAVLGGTVVSFELYRRFETSQTELAAAQAELAAAQAELAETQRVMSSVKINLKEAQEKYTKIRLIIDELDHFRYITPNGDKIHKIDCQYILSASEFTAVKFALFLDKGNCSVCNKYPWRP